MTSTPTFAVGVFTTGDRSLDRLESRLAPHRAFREYVVEYDRTRKGPWFPCKALLEHFVTLDVTHAVLLADDALPCNNFFDVLEEAIAHVAGELVSLYSASETSFDALKLGLSWYTSPNGCLQVTIPRKLIQEFLDFVEFAATPFLIEGFKEDGLANLWCMATGRPVITPAVSIIDHANPPSLLGHDRHKYRRPAIRPYEDMRGLNWNTQALQAPLHTGSHWSLVLMQPQAQEKYRVHSKVYELQQRVPSGGCRGHEGSGSD